MKLLMTMLIMLMLACSPSDKTSKKENNATLSKEKINRKIKKIKKQNKTPEGNWIGKLKVNDSTSIKIVFIIEKRKDTYISKLGSPDQIGVYIPANTTEIKNNEIKIELKNLSIVFNGKIDLKKGIINGIFTQNGQELPLKMLRTKNIDFAKIIYKQMPKKPYSYKNENVTFKNTKAGITLAGTLTYPQDASADKKVPAIILISGSGPNDRDETPMKHFLLLSDRLTKQGFAVLRFDKRGVNESGGDYKTATTFDFAEDIYYAVEYMLKKEFVNAKKIGLIGHSEGAMIAAIIAAERKDISFMVLMGAPGVTGEKLLLKQSEDIMRRKGLPEKRIAEVKEKNSEIYKILRKNSSEKDSALKKKLLKIAPDIKDAQIQQILSPWFRTFTTFDPSVYLEKIDIPVFVMSGEKDLQVSAYENNKVIRESFEKAGNKNYKITIFKNLNHLFQKCKTGLPSEYAKLPEIINENALKALKAWLSDSIIK